MFRLVRHYCEYNEIILFTKECELNVSGDEFHVNFEYSGRKYFRRLLNSSEKILEFKTKTLNIWKFIILSIIELILLVKLPKVLFIIYTIYALFSIGINIRPVFSSDSREKYMAVNMVNNAYRDLKRVPSLEEAKRYSKIAERCSLNLGILRFVLYIIFIIQPIPVYILSTIFHLYNIDIVFTPIQFFIGKNMSDTDIKLAILGYDKLAEIVGDDSLVFEREKYLILGTKCIFKPTWRRKEDNSVEEVDVLIDDTTKEEIKLFFDNYYQEYNMPYSSSTFIIQVNGKEMSIDKDNYKSVVESIII